MFIRKKKNRSGSTSVVVVNKSGGKFIKVKTIGVSKNPSEIDSLYNQGKKWIKVACRELKSYFNEDVDLNKLYRYLDKLHDIQKEMAQEN